MYQRVVLLSLQKASTFDIEFTDVAFENKRGFRGPMKKILKGVSGTFKSGELSAIMGPSGAGKSTLLNILTGFQNDKWTGQIEYVGDDGKHTWKEYKKQSCYIQQDDIIHPLFTVSEAMWMAINLKIGSSLSQKSKEMLIDDMLDNLDLSKTKQTRCSRLSGGQKKRLSIALELLDNPPVMFFDEPTTGLDSLSSMQCIRLLHDLAKSGRTIVCTIHQPSAAIYELFDYVYLLAEGRCMYEGATKNTIAYFASVGLQCPKYHNPADYMIEVASNEYGNFRDQLAKLAAKNEKSWRLETPRQTNTNYMNETKAAVLIQPPSEFERFSVLLHYCMVQLFRDWTTVHLKIFLHFVVGILLGLLYNGSGQDGNKSFTNVGLFVVTTLYLCYTSMMPAVLKFPSEIATLKKERFNNWYQLRTYYLASFICSVPLQIIFAFVYSSPSYFLSRQPMDMNRFFMYLGAAIMNTLLAESFGLLIGIMMNPVNGTFLGSILIATMLILSGFLANFRYMPRGLYYTSYLSHQKYAVHAFVTAIYGFNREKLECPKMYCHYSVPFTLLDELSMTGGRYWLDILILFINYAIIKFVAYFLLKRRLSTA